MSVHLNECQCYEGSCCSWMVNCTCQCICDVLRACEERVRNQDIATHHADLKEAKALLASRDEAWFAGLDAAREAVAALPEYALRDTCVSAIDELREEGK